MAKIAVMIPCLNEELTIANVIKEFRAELPEADIYVFDNDSTDATAKEAAAAGAIVIPEMRRGKGFVVQSMFRSVDADVYVMVDGDSTYPASSVNELIRPVLDGRADMTVGSRLQAEDTEFHPLNRLGNRFFLLLVNFFLRTRLTDILSGYRAMSRNFVKGMPMLTGGFEVETELTIKAVQRRYRIQEVPTTLVPRPRGSHSKIRIVQDGLRILGTIISLVRDYKPLTTFGSIGLVQGLLGVILGLRFLLGSTQALTTPEIGMVALAIVCLLCSPVFLGIGLTLHVISRHFMELEYLYTQLDASRWNRLPVAGATGGYRRRQAA